MNCEIETSFDPVPDDFFKYKDTIKTIDELDDDYKGKWIEMSNEELQNQMSGLMDFFDGTEYDNIDWSTLNFKIYDEEYYQEKYPGFDDKIYKILADSTKPENKVKDERTAPLQIKHEEVTLKFD